MPESSEVTTGSPKPILTSEMLAQNDQNTLTSPMTDMSNFLIDVSALDIMPESCKVTTSSPKPILTSIMLALHHQNTMTTP